MNSQRRFKKLAFVLSVAMLFGQSAIGQTPRSDDERDARTRNASSRQAAVQQELRPVVPEIEGQDKDRGEEQERDRREDPDSRLDDPAGALRFRQLQMQDENGYIPPDGLEKARRHVKMMKVEQQKRIKARQQSAQISQEPQVGILAAGVEPDSWQPLGPGNVGGRIRSIVIDPRNTNNMWVGSVGGGIWATQNGENPRASWFPVNDFLANLAVSTMIINPINPNIMYAGTGEGFGNTDAIQGAGIFQSTDSGVTWNQLATTANANFFFVNRLAISPDGSIILAATNTGIWRSVDGGATWGQRTNTRALDIDFHPTDSSQAIAGELGNARLSTDGGRIWTFTNNGVVRNAATFTPGISNGGTAATDGRVELAYAPSNPAIVYASVNQNSGEVYRSSDGGRNYTRVNTGTNYLGAPSIGWYTNALWVNPQDASFIIVGGVFLWRSINNGTTLTQISNGVRLMDGTASPHADNHVILSHPGFNNNTNQRVFVGNDGGIYRTDIVRTANPSNGWVALNNQLSITQFFGAAGNPASGVIVGGAQDNGTQRFTGNTEGWTSAFGNDGGNCAADSTDPKYFYGESQNLAVHRSTDGGVMSKNIFAGSPVANNGINDANNPNNTNFIAPLVLDQNDPNTLLAGGISLWRSQDAKATTPTWAAIKAPVSNGLIPPSNVPISAIAVSPITSSLIFVGHNDGSIYRTFGGTLSSPQWQRVSTAALPPRMVTRLVVDTTRGVNWIYATFGGFSANNVWRSTDNGQTWANTSGVGATALPSVPVRTLAFHPTNSNLLYVGTEIGIFTSEDAGANWEPTQDGPANVSVEELFWMGEDLIAATHGRGLYRASGGVYVRCGPQPPFENGSFSFPFNTVTEAVNATNRYRAIWIFSGTCTEPFDLPISKRLELRSLGGPATLRQP